MMFRYCYDLYRTEEQTAFDYAEISEVLTGDECKMTASAIGTQIRRLQKVMKELSPPISLTIERETLQIHEAGYIPSHARRRRRKTSVTAD
jgi:hypothetical protein